MPAIIPAIIAGVTAAGTAIAAGGTVLLPFIGAVGAVSAFFIVTGTTLALSLLSQALAPKPSFPDLSGFGATSSGRTQMVRQPVTPWDIVYGEVIKSGPITFIESTDDNKFLHIIVTLASHACDSIKVVYLNDDPVYPDLDLDGSDVVNTGKYNGKLKIQVDLGTTGSQPFPDLVTASSTWTNAWRQEGRTKIYLRLEFDKDLYSGQVPNVKVLLRGKQVSGSWTNNPATIISDYLQTSNANGGLGVASADINSTVLTASENICDEEVDTKDLAATVQGVDTTNDRISVVSAIGEVLPYQIGDRVQFTSTGSIPGGLSLATDYYIIPVIYQTTDDGTGTIGWYPQFQVATSYANALAGTQVNITDVGSGTITVTKNGEPRYTAGGVVTTDRRPVDILQDLRSAMAGRLTFVAGKWLIKAGAWVSPTITYDEGDLRGAIQIQTKHPRRDRFNAVKGLYASPLTKGQPTEYPSVTSTAYETEDGGNRIFRDIDLPFTPRPQTSQRIAKIELERHRRQVTAQIPLNLTGMQVQSLDTVNLTNDRFGWSSKSFEAVEWKLIVDGEPPALGVDMVVQEADSTIFDFNEATEETQPTAPPSTNLPSATTVTAPTGLTLESGTNALFLKKDGTVVSRIKVTWTDSTDFYVTKYEIQFKKSSDSNWEPLVDVSPDVELAYVWEVDDGDDYDVRIRAVNHIGVRSSWVTSSNHTVIGKTTVPNNVVSFTAQQNGNVVVFKWEQVSDADLSGYEIRYMKSPFTFADATPLTAVTKGTQVTSAAVPPSPTSGGSQVAWVFGIKAKDTSGNFSTTAKTYSLIVKNTFDIVDQTAEAPSWTGLGYGLSSTKSTAAGNVAVITNSTNMATIPVTLEFWLTKKSFNSTAAENIIYQNPLSVGNRHWNFYVDVNADLYYLQDTTTGGLLNTLVSTALEFHKPAHVAVVLDGTATGSTVKFYIDGTLVKSTQLSNPVINSTGDFSLFARQFSNGFTGQIDDFRAWGVARDSTAIDYYKDRRLTGDETNLLVYVPFDSGSAVDETTNNHTVTLTTSRAELVRVSTPGHMIKHWTGKLVMETNEAADSTSEDIFDNYVSVPYDRYTYTATEKDLGFNSPAVRMWADIESSLAPGETTGTADPTFKLDYKQTTEKYDGFEEWTVGTADVRKVFTRFEINPNLGKPVVVDFIPTLDLEERQEIHSGTTVSSASSGTTLGWNNQFNNIPNVQITPQSTLAVYPTHSNVSVNGVKIRLFNSGGNQVSGTVDVIAEGA